MLPYVREHVAAFSVALQDNGEWGWKFDRRLFGKMATSWPEGQPGGCPAAIIRAQHGLMTPQMASRLCGRLGQAATVFEIPVAGHHVLLDEPLCLVTALRAVLAGWATASPRVLSGPRPAVSQ